MLAYICCDDRIIKLTVDLFNNILWSHVNTILHRQRMFFLPLCDLLSPLLRLTVFYIFIHLCDCLKRICNDRHINMNISGNGRCININMDNLCIRCKLMQLSCDTVIETCSDREQKVTFTDCHIRSICAMHSKISYIKRVICRNCSTSHDRCNDRNFCLLYNFCKHVIRTGNIHTASCKE